MAETTDTTMPAQADEHNSRKDSGVLMRDLSPDEKPREKALSKGMDALNDVELLALLLGSGLPGKSVLDLSREILADNDNRLRNLSRRPIREFIRKYKGVGEAKAILLCAAMTFGARVQADLEVADPVISCSRNVRDFMRHRLERLNYEEFWVLHLNRANRVMDAERISKGGLSATVVDARIIAKSAIDHLSSGLILVHNHPSGNMRPSPQDDSLTKSIVDICRIINVTVADHVIIGPAADYYSYRDEGRL